MKENIEEDLMKLERFSNETVLYGNTVAMTLERYKNLQLSTEHILSDYKRVLKENEELKEEYKNAQACANMVFDKVIPVKKVKDKIEELKEERASKYDNYMGYKIESREQQDINKKIDILQELLEEKGE